MAILRNSFTEAVTTEDVQEIVATLVRQAKDGCPQSAKLVLDRALGKPSILDSEDPPDEEPRLPTIEERLATLGPVTPETIEQHRALRMAQIAQRGAV